MERIKIINVGSIKNINFIQLEEVDENIVTLAPILNGVDAGPEDLFIPKEIFGTTKVVSFELAFSIEKERVNDSEISLSEDTKEYIENNYKALEKGERHLSGVWGWQYLDEHDVRYRHHGFISQIIEKLQYVPEA